jgi:1,4-dihydroxy-2-naphthoate polyprenyltransferase
MSSPMQSKDAPANNTDAISKTKAVTSSHIVRAESAQAEEVPTIPLDSLQKVSQLQPEISVHPVASTRSVTQPVSLVVSASEHERTLREWLTVWWEGIRPGYLPLSLLPVVLGSIVAWTQSISLKTPRGEFYPIRFIMTLAAVLLLQIGAHLVNDYYDYLRGIDTGNSLGPGGLIQQGLIQPVRVLYAGAAALGLGALLGIFVAISGVWLLFVFGLLGLLAAYFYSATSRALSLQTLGELVSFCIFGPILTLAAYMVQRGHLDRIAFVCGISLGFLAAAFIHLNNMRDAESDAQAGKNTLASSLDLHINRVLYLILVLAAYAPIIALGVPRHAPHLLLLVLWTLPGLVVAVTTVLRTDSPASLHLAMYQTLKIEIFFTFLLIVAFVVTAFIPLLPPLPSLPSLTLPV